MGTCITKMPHDCGSSDALQVFEHEDGSLQGYCFSCGDYIPNPLGKGKTIEDIPVKQRLNKSQEEIDAELAEILTYKVVDLPERRLRAGALDYFGIKIGMSEQDGVTPAFHYYPYTNKGETVGYKVRHIDSKRMWSIGKQSEVDLFGWEEAVETGARRLIITEGELDAVAIHRILEIYTSDNFTDYIPAVCSLPHGAAAAGKDIARLLDKINRNFKQISLCFDQDDAGAKATADVCKIVPHATSIDLPSKDANACLMDGKGKAAFKAITFKAEIPKNTSLVFGEDLHDKAREQAKYGELTWPWDHIQEATRGIRYGETIYLGAGVKMGKSELLNALGAHFMKKHDIPVFMAKPEEANNKTYKLLAGKIAGKIFHDPNIPFDYDAYDRAGDTMKGKLSMVNLYQHLGWETLKADIYAAAAWGAKVVFIDPITNLTNGMEAADANVKLQGFAQELSAMALDLGIVVFIFCHLKSPQAGLDHEHGGEVLSSQFAGSRAMMRSCNLMIGLEGDKTPELPPEEKNMRGLVLLEDREFGNTGKYDLYWDMKTGLFNEA
jgi:twinkle protein